MSTAPAQPVGSADTDSNDIRERIVHILTHFPILSPSMLQTGIGNTKPRYWKPVLEVLIEEGVVKREYDLSIAPSGRDHHYQKLSLSDSTSAT